MIFPNTWLLPLALTLLLSSRGVLGQIDNIFLGPGAGNVISSSTGLASDGDKNLMCGVDSGRDTAVTVSETVLIGHSAGKNLQTNGQTFIGYQAGAQATTTYDSTIVGHKSGSAGVLTGNKNTFFGALVGEKCTTCSDNTFVGRRTGRECTSCRDNTMVGSNAAIKLTTGQQNTGLGKMALEQLTTGNRNVAIGRSALQDVTNGTGNLAFGYMAGLDLSTGVCNSFVGARAGENNEFSSFNTFVGAASGIDNDRNAQNNAKANTYVGTASGYGQRVGSYNTIIGALADSTTVDQAKLENDCRNEGGRGRANPQVFDNIQRDDMVGLGAQLLVKASKVTALGAKSHVSVEGGVALGHQAQVSGSAINSVAIGAGTTVTQPNVIALGGDQTSGTPMAVGIDNTTPNPHASLDLGATDKGLLLNRLTTNQRYAMSYSLTATEAGMVVFDTSLKKIFVWTSNLYWEELTKKQYTMQATAGNLGTGTPTVYYGGPSATGGMVSDSNAKILSLAVVLNGNLASGSLTFDVSINGTPQNQPLSISTAGKKTGLIKFSSAIAVAAGDLIEITATDSSSSGAAAASMVLKLESQQVDMPPPTNAPSVAPSKIPSASPSSLPSISPSSKPSLTPSVSGAPSETPSSKPSVYILPTKVATTIASIAF